MDGHKKSI